MLIVIKRDGREVAFDASKITNAIMSAMMFGSGIIKPEVAKSVTDEVTDIMTSAGKMSVSEIENAVFEKLVSKGEHLTAKAYEGYRSVREFQRNTSNTTDKDVSELLRGDSEYWNEENSNKNAMLVSTQRDYMAGIESEDISKRFLLPPDVIQAHDDGIIHFHDIDYFAQNALHNCDLVNLDDMLQNGTVISGIKIEKPHSFSTACNVATQIIAQVASCQYGGQSISLTHLAPFVDVSRQRIRDSVKRELKATNTILPDKTIEEITALRLADEVKKGIQTIQYQIITLMTTNGQAPFLSVFMYLGETDDPQTKADLALIIEETLRQRIQGVKNEQGAWITPAFPKLLYVLDEENTYEGSPYFYLTKLAAECSAKRMVPDYISAKKMLEYKIDKNGNGNVYACMGCRSFLTPYVNKDGKPQYYGRFNQGVVTINLPDLALSSGGDMEKFWQLFQIRTELCHKALRIRHERLRGTVSDVAPILWQHGALARLGKGEKIDDLLYGGYSTISLGYAGLYECVKYMTGHSHTDGDIGEAFGLKVMQALNDKCAQWKAAENIDYSLYGAPIESVTYKFAKCLKRRFGEIAGITDKDYVTNSYHVHVTEQINAFDKLAIEAKFQRLSPGGAISYVEVPNLDDNIPAVLQIVQFIYENIMYAELNSKSDYCMVCGFDKEIRIITDIKSGKLVWECPQCGNRNQALMNVARRTCGKQYCHNQTIEIQGNPKSDSSDMEILSQADSHNKQHICEVCGRREHKKHRVNGMTVCNKHYKQFKKYGKFLDQNPRTIYDLNAVHVEGDITYIDLYNKYGDVVAQAIIDTEDLQKVRYIKWKKSAAGYAVNTPKFAGKSRHMSRMILGTDSYVDHINHNTLDNRKSNLRAVTKSQNAMNSDNKGVSLRPDGKHYAYIKVNQRMLNLGVYVYEEEALYARWLSEQMLFGKYAYPKEKPHIAQKRAEEINNYVKRKVQRL